MRAKSSSKNVVYPHNFTVFLITNEPLVKNTFLSKKNPKVKIVKNFLSSAEHRLGSEAYYQFYYVLMSVVKI